MSDDHQAWSAGGRAFREGDPADWWYMAALVLLVVFVVTLVALFG